MIRLVRFSVGLVWSAARAPFIWLVILQLSSGALLAGQVLAVQWVLNGILSISASSDAVATVSGAVVLLVVLTAATAIIGAVQTSLARYVGESVARAMWQRVLDVSTTVGLKSFESSEFFDRLERVRSSALTRPFLVTNGVIACIGAIAAGTGLAITLASFHPLLLPLLVLSGLPVLLTSRRESVLEFRFTVAQTQRIRRRQYTSILLTGREEAKEVRAFGLAANLRARFDGLYEKYLEALRAHLRQRARYSVIGQFTSAVVLGATLLTLVWLIATGGLDIASAGAALVAVRLLASQVQTLSGGIQTIFESGLFIDDLEEFIALAPAAPGVLEPATPLETAAIDAKNITFSYPGAASPAVDDVSVRIGAGQVIALVGENGSGKTTLAKIVGGLYPPDAGTISWNGVDASGIDARTVAASTAYIFQDFVHYAMEAETNIALGRADAAPDPARVRAAAAAAGADGFIEQLPGGYDTLLTRLFEGGTDLSGGQWQRLAIARAFYRNAPLVILDEPSAALDPRAEYDLFSSLRNTIKGRSALVISHRFSTVRNADRIYVMADGRVAEEGTHDELMRRGGIYADLFTLQASAYLSDAAPEHPAE